ncbi:MAG: hypothetical protein HETSPECPRED_005188 [Heterodermia speciosa]|uniref:Uncharacterized protein n=1 Tax=Heterodermia speciosa TaxID=116794 RepID=A0A8H3FG68_9LECA|nr:MAG: hypothetical protein HETSPECPRED_005188 [Heterodermia speciosa]
MNTIRSTWYGWGALICAGGGAYFLAKRSINADKKARHEEDMQRRLAIQNIDAATTTTQPPKKKKKGKNVDNTASPASEASHDPAPTRHTPEHEAQNEIGKSQYEASVPYRSKKGDRFS